jgi:hypothetical protein
MKRILFFLILQVPFVASMAATPINPVVGDRSWITRFGEAPSANTDENLRIRTHLQFVKRILESKATNHLSVAVQQKRKQALLLLGDYIAAGIFPGNYDVPEKRVPCFIDKENRICAVGYLVAETAGTEVAQRINKLHQYDEIYAMKEGFIMDWMAQNGLTQEECAMIQPAYNPMPRSNLEPAHWVTSSVLGGTNIALCVLNGIEITHGSSRRTVGILSLATGIAQSSLGAVLIAQSGALSPSSNWVYEDRFYVGCANAGLGFCTVFLGIYNNVHHKERMKEKRTALNVYSPALAGRKPGIVFSMVRTF